MPDEFFFKDFLGRVIGPFPSEEIALKADKDFNTWLWKSLWKETHGGFLYK